MGAHIDNVPVIPALKRYRSEVPGAVWLAGLAVSVVGPEESLLNK